MEQVAITLLPWDARLTLRDFCETSPLIIIVSPDVSPLCPHLDLPMQLSEIENLMTVFFLDVPLGV